LLGLSSFMDLGMILFGFEGWDGWNLRLKMRFLEEDGWKLDFLGIYGSIWMASLITSSRVQYC